MNIIETKVGKIVSKNFKTAKILSRYGIDFCCRGGISLEEACKQYAIDIDKILPEIEKVLAEPVEVDYTQWDIPQLIDQILKVHHEYVRSSIPTLQTYLEKLVSIHGKYHPELYSIQELFSKIAKHLLKHLAKEETVLFPYILALVEAKKKGEDMPEAHFGSVANPISMLEHEHQTEREKFRQIAQLSNHYQCPPNVCQTYIVTFAMLDEFEKDLLTHIHLENNLLFPKAKAVFRASLLG